MPTETTLRATRHHTRPTAAGQPSHDFVTAFRANPGLAMSGMLNAQRPTTYQGPADGTDTHPDLRPTPTLPSSTRLPGTVRITRHTTSRAASATGPDLTTGPSRRDLAAILAAEELVHDVLTVGLPPTLAEQSKTFEHHLAAVISRHARTGLDRRGPMFAEAAARYITTWAHPVGLTFARTNFLRKWYGETCDELDYRGSLQRSDGPDDTSRPDGTSHPRFTASFIRRPRIAWTHPDGPSHGLLLDRVHHAARPGKIERDVWAHRKVADDLRDLAAFLAPTAELTGNPATPHTALLGVRVLTHLAPNAGVHFLPAFTGDAMTGALPVIGAHHRIGDCSWCATTAHLPAATPAPDNTAAVSA